MRPRYTDPRLIQAQRLAAQRDARWRAAMEREIADQREAFKREAEKQIDAVRQSAEEREQALQAEIEQLRQALEQQQAESAEQQDEYVRRYAEMENSRKRLRRTANQQAEAAKENVLRDLIGVIDNLERALKFSENGNQDGLAPGIEATLRQWHQTLERHGVRPIDAAGQTFDPQLHEAIGTVQDGQQPPDTVVHVEQTGYTINDKLLRPARVLVSA